MRPEARALADIGGVNIRAEVAIDGRDRKRPALGPDGARVSGFASVALPERMDVRAIFTIWPPGTRPPGR